MRRRRSVCLTQAANRCDIELIRPLLRLLDPVPLPIFAGDPLIPEEALPRMRRLQIWWIDAEVTLHA
jgi:hypothetical protein